MAASNCSLLLLFLLSSSAFVVAFDITKILTQFPNFSSFSNLLNQTELTELINGRRTITVLAVDNAALSAVSGQPADVLKKVLSVHVILDYYDTAKFQNLRNGTAILTTLFQASGLAIGQTGFLNATVLGSGKVALGSAEPGSPLDANVMKDLATQPYNISVVQVSAVIVPPGIADATNSSGGSKTPSPAPTASTPTQAPSASNSTALQAPSPSASKHPAPPGASPPAAPGSSPAASPNISAGAPGPAQENPADASKSAAAPAVVGARAVVSVGAAILSALL